ncbi:MAG: hypothetical protein IPN13_22980, partial [Bacteroidetes bacterium]|nr:hypothetical protein [Bacteroidota bacterium]
SDTICAGSIANISIAITGGVTPYELVINDGVSDSTYTNYVSGSDITVSPDSSTIYTIVSVTDAGNNVGTGNVRTYYNNRESTSSCPQFLDLHSFIQRVTQLC